VAPTVKICEIRTVRMVARGRFEFGSYYLPSAGLSSGEGDPEPSSSRFLAPMLCVVPTSV
jgi:hypothetical protein